MNYKLKTLGHRFQGCLAKSVKNVKVCSFENSLAKVSLTTAVDINVPTEQLLGVETKSSFVLVVVTIE